MGDKTCFDLRELGIYPSLLKVMV